MSSGGGAASARPAAAPAHSNHEPAGTARDCLDLRPPERASRLTRRAGGPRAWTAESLGAPDWTIPVPPDACAELEAVAQKLRRDPLPLLRLSPGLFALDECRRMMERVKRELDDGTGFVLLDGLPLDALSADEARGVYWVLGRLLSSPVATKWDGTMLYGVTDTGAAHGYGVRGAATNVELVFHNDNAYGVAVPDYVSLMCLRPARAGGVTRLCSLYTVHDTLLDGDPDLLARLYEPFYFDRQAEHAPGAPRVSRAPVFGFDGTRLLARIARSLVYNGYALLGETLDRDGARSIDTVDEIMHEDGNFVTFSMRRGQVQFLNNRFIAHHRSRFEDDPDPTRKRHLVRMWYRDTGAAFYDG